MVLARAPSASGLRYREGREEADEGRAEEEALGEDREPVLHEHAAERRPGRPHQEAREGESEHAPGRDPADRAPVGAAVGETHHEDEQQQTTETQLQRERTREIGGRHQGPTIRARSGTVAVSTGRSAIAGAIPKRTSTVTRMTSATHSGPRASSR